MKFLLITANVGSLFNETSCLQSGWCNELSKKITSLQPQFVAIHFQEVGGKTLQSYADVAKFFSDFCDRVSTENESYDQFHNYFIDTNCDEPSKYTALGSMYFVHSSLANDCSLWNFKHNRFNPCSQVPRHVPDIGSVAHAQHQKFPQEFFPEFKWTRKGFLRTRWKLQGLIFDSINIHLFHDASNVIASQEVRSVYAKHREQALNYALNWLEHDNIERFGTADQPLFIYGDFNFRLCSKELIEEVTAECSKDLEDDVWIYRTNGKSLLSLSSRLFDADSKAFGFQIPLTLLRHDRELAQIALNELPITFDPTYSYIEDADKPFTYAKSRCRAWCDRVLMNDAAFDLITNSNNAIYNVIGPNTCMGDHKPVYLAADVDVSDQNLENKKGKLQHLGTSTSPTGEGQRDQNDTVNEGPSTTTTTTKSGQIIDVSRTSAASSATTDTVPATEASTCCPVCYATSHVVSCSLFSSSNYTSASYVHGKNHHFPLHFKSMPRLARLTSSSSDSEDDDVPLVADDWVVHDRRSALVRRGSSLMRCKRKRLGLNLYPSDYLFRDASLAAVADMVSAHDTHAAPSGSAESQLVLPNAISNCLLCRWNPEDFDFSSDDDDDDYNSFVSFDSGCESDIGVSASSSASSFPDLPSPPPSAVTSDKLDKLPNSIERPLQPSIPVDRLINNSFALSASFQNQPGCYSQTFAVNFDRKFTTGLPEFYSLYAEDDRLVLLKHYILALEPVDDENNCPFPTNQQVYTMKLPKSFGTNRLAVPDVSHRTDSSRSSIQSVEFVSIVMLNDEGATSVMDASSYGVHHDSSSDDSFMFSKSTTIGVSSPKRDDGIVRSEHGNQSNSRRSGQSSYHAFGVPATETEVFLSPDVKTADDQFDGDQGARPRRPPFAEDEKMLRSKKQVSRVLSLIKEEQDKPLLTKHRYESSDEHTTHLRSRMLQGAKPPIPPPPKVNRHASPKTTDSGISSPQSLLSGRTLSQTNVPQEKQLYRPLSFSSELRNKIRQRNGADEDRRHQTKEFGQLNVKTFELDELFQADDYLSMQLPEIARKWSISPQPKKSPRASGFTTSSTGDSPEQFGFAESALRNSRRRIAPSQRSVRRHQGQKLDVQGRVPGLSGPGKYDSRTPSSSTMSSGIGGLGGSGQLYLFPSISEEVNDDEHDDLSRNHSADTIGQAFRSGSDIYVDDRLRIKTPRSRSSDDHMRGGDSGSDYGPTLSSRLKNNLVIDPPSPKVPSARKRQSKVQANGGLLKTVEDKSAAPQKSPRHYSEFITIKNDAGEPTMVYGKPTPANFGPPVQVPQKENDTFYYNLDAVRASGKPTNEKRRLKAGSSKADVAKLVRESIERRNHLKEEQSSSPESRTGKMDKNQQSRRLKRRGHVDDISQPTKENEFSSQTNSRFTNDANSLRTERIARQQNGKPQWTDWKLVRDQFGVDTWSATVVRKQPSPRHKSEAPRPAERRRQGATGLRKPNSVHPLSTNVAPSVASGRPNGPAAIILTKPQAFYPYHPGVYPQFYPQYRFPPQQRSPGIQTNASISSTSTVDHQGGCCMQ